MSQNGDGLKANLRLKWRAALGWALVVVGAVFIVIGWFGVSGEPDVARQLSYLASGGLGGVAAAIVGIGLVISEDLRSERKRLGRIESSILDVSEELRGSRSGERSNGRTTTKSASRRGR
jgi:hypothetical protein